MNTDESGNAWWNWLLAGLSIIAAVAISVVTFGSATPVLIGAGIGALVGGGFEAGRQLITTGQIYDWGAIGLSALGGMVSGAISAIPIGGTGLVSFLGTFTLGGFGSTMAGIVTGTVTDITSAIKSFGIGGAAAVVSRGIVDLFSYIKATNIANLPSKVQSLKIQHLQSSKFNMGSSALKGSMRNSFKGYTVSQIFKLINNASFALRNGLYSSILSSTLGGWN